MSLKKKPIYFLVIIAFIIILGYLFFYVIFPYMFIGGPTSLFGIINHDTKNHIITIKIFDSTNKTVLSQSYNIQPDIIIEYNRGFGWYPTITWTPITWSEGEYTFIAVLDGNFSVSYTTNVNIFQTISIEIIPNDSEPLEIREVCT